MSKMMDEYLTTHIDGWWKYDRTLLERLSDFAVACVGHKPKTIKKEFKKHFTGKFDDGGSVVGHVEFDLHRREATFYIKSKNIPDATGIVILSPSSIEVRV